MVTTSADAKIFRPQGSAPQANIPNASVDSTPQSDAMSAVATIGVVVVGAAIVEAALIPAILVGAAAALAPKFLPTLGVRMQPLFDSTVRGAVKMGRKARAAVGEAQERIGDISAEVAAQEAAATHIVN
jgi:hypothetical protein